MDAPVFERWWSTAARPSTVRRASAMAVIVGTVLAAINHGDAIVAGTIGGADIARVTVTYLVPYTVSTVSSVLAVRDAALNRAPSHPYVPGRSVQDTR